MKKTLISSIFLLSLSTSQAFAQDLTSGVYVQGDLGYSSLQLGEEDYYTGNNKGSFDQRISLGYAVDSNSTSGVSPRIALDYTHFGNSTFSDDQYYDATLKIQSFGISAFADFKTDSGFTPYIGARLSANHATISAKAHSSNISYPEWTQFSVGIGVLGGLQYNFTPNVAVNLGVEYNRLFSDVNQFGSKIGLRYNF